LLQRVVRVAVVLDGDVDLRVRVVEPLCGSVDRLALDVLVAVPHRDVDDAVGRASPAARRCGGEQDEQGQDEGHHAFHGSTTDRVRLRGESGSRPRTAARRIAILWAATRVASGCAPLSRSVAPVARISAARAGSRELIATTAVSSSASAIGPCRYSMAG